MKIVCILTLMLFFSLFASAQNEEDAIRFSRIFPFGTARSAAMGSAFGALGGDLSTLSTNPGGIGVFRKSEASFTSMLDFAHAKTGKFDYEKNMYLLGDLGFVLSFTPMSDKWKNVNIGFNYTNLNNFNKNIYQGNFISKGSSLIDVWKAEADGKPTSDLNPFTTRLAYDAYLLNLPEGSTDNIYDIPINNTHSVEELKYTKERGYQAEYAISAGANYDDKFYFGATLGIQSLHFKSYSHYTEWVVGDGIDSKLKGFTFDQDFTTSGTGVNFKFGMIYRPIPAIRIGAAIHTPTYYNLDAYAMNWVSSEFVELPFEGADPGNDLKYGMYQEADYSYKLKTPWRVIGSLATVLGQRAIISADYEYIDYTSAKFTNSGSGNEYVATNDAIKTIYKSTHNFRVGAEYRFNSLFCARGGYAYSASPYSKGEMNEKNDVQTITGGLGLNFGVFYADFAYLHKNSKLNGLFYYYETSKGEVIESPEFQTKFKDNEFRLTLGIRF